MCEDWREILQECYNLAFEELNAGKIQNSNFKPYFWLCLEGKIDWDNRWNDPVWIELHNFFTEYREDNGVLPFLYAKIPNWVDGLGSFLYD
jgi:hypothetical protein